MNAPAPARYPISVVVPSLRGWPTMAIALNAVLPQVVRAGGQLIIADGSGRDLPETFRDHANVVWLRVQHPTVFELRQAGYERAEADLIAVTEDHCRPAADWVESVIAAHAEDSAAAAIFGSVENGTTRHAIDWAVYCAGYGTQAPPISRTAELSPGHANTSWKRWAFERVARSGDRVIEFRFNAALRAAGERVVADPRMRVRHFQCDDVATTTRLFFDNGRAIAGIRRERMEAADWARAAAPGLLAALRTVRTLRTTLARPAIRRHALRSTPFIALLHLAHTWGESLGYMVGPGDSGRRLH